MWLWFVFLTLGLLSAPELFGAGRRPLAAILYSGKGDGAFIDEALVGVKQAKAKFGIETIEIAAATKKSWVKAVKGAIAEGVPLIVNVGFQSYLPESLGAMAKEFPQTRFSTIDFEVTGDNIVNYVFKEEEGSYLAGYAAAKFSKTGVVGFIGGMPVPAIVRFEKGYSQGARAARKDIAVLLDYLGPLTDGSVWANPTKGKALAQRQYSKNADVIFAAAGGSGLGVFEAAQEVKKYAIGVDRNQNNLAPGVVITSIVKRVDILTYKLLKAMHENTMSRGIHRLGLREGAVGLAIDEQSTKLLSKELVGELHAVEERIKAGIIAIETK